MTDFVASEELKTIDNDVSTFLQNHGDLAAKSRSTSGLQPKETVAITGLLAKSPTVAKICEYPVLKSVRNSILKEEFTIPREEVEPAKAVIDPLLSLSITFWIGPGASRQRLHRDDWIHGTRHDQPFQLNRAGQIGVLIAGTKTTRRNGATMFIPGSHKWDDNRKPRLDEVTFAGKYFFVFLCSDVD